MSRWVENFENHAFQKTWSDIKSVVNDIRVVDETIVTDVKEVARLKKVISLIDSLLRSLDPELVPVSTWNNFNNQAIPCLSQLNNYQQNKSISHIQQANSHIDNILTYVRPYEVSDGDIGEAVIIAFKEYSHTVEEQILQLKNKTAEIVRITMENKEKTKVILDEANVSKNKIDNLDKYIFENRGEGKGIKEEYIDIYNDFQAKLAEINSFYQKLLSGTQNEGAIVLQVEDAKKKVISNSKEVEGYTNTTKEYLEKLGDFYKKIFGSETEGSIGLEQELEKRLKELSDFKENQAKTYETLLDQIESLLPGATSAGLATAYSELKDSYSTSIKVFSGIFYVSQVAIFGLALYLVNHLSSITLDSSVSLATVISGISYRLLLITPPIWLAIFSSRRRSENRRLEQEYAHKEALAKSYHSFKQQVKDLNDNDDRLMKQLLENMISAIAFNASCTLDGKHGDNMPILETIERISESLSGKVLDKINLGKK